MQINGALQSTALNVVGGTSTSDMGYFEHTGATASDNVTFVLKRTNQTGTQLYLDLWDSSNGKRGGINVGAVRINNLTVAIDTNNVHTAYKINLTDTTYQIRCNSDVMFTNLAQNAYVGIRARFLDIQGSACIDASKNITCNNLTVAGTCTGVTAIVPGVTAFNVTASANVRNSHDASYAMAPGAAYFKRKTITFPNGLGPGTYRVYFEAAVSGSGVGAAYGRVYKNGTAIGTARSGSTTTFVGWDQDFNGPLNPGDTIELWGYFSGDAGATGYLRNFRVKYDLSLSMMPSVNS